LSINLKNSSECKYTASIAQFPNTGVFPKDQYNHIKFRENECIVKNADGAACDWFSCRKSTDGRNCYFFGQGKLTNKNKIFTIDDIKSEWKKVHDTIANLKEKHNRI